MKKVQNNRHNMHLATQSVLNKNAARLITISGYPELKAKLDDSIAKEDELDAEQYAHKNYRALPKNLARKAAGDYALDLVSKLSSLALINRNYTLLEEVKLTATGISRRSDISLVLTIQNVITLANENLAALACYGVTAETLSKGTALLGVYETERAQLAKIKIELTGLTQQLEKQLRATLAEIHIVDGIIESMRLSDPQLYNSYWIARAKQNSACTKVSVKGRVFEAETGEPLQGAILTVERATDSNPQTAGNEPVRKIRIRSSNGWFQFKLFTSGAYIFKVSYYGCIAREFTVYFNEGVLTHVELPLTRIGEFT
jgi:hypothetical protein